MPLLLALASSIAFVASFPPYQRAVLPWLTLAPLFVAIEIAESTSKAVFVASLWGMMSAYRVTSWLPRAITTYWEQPFLFGLAIFVCASALMGCLQYALFASCIRRTTGMKPPSPLFMAAAWVSAEYARCTFLGGNPWGLLGYTLAVPSTAATTSTSSILRRSHCRWRTSAECTPCPLSWWFRTRLWRIIALPSEPEPLI